MVSYRIGIDVGGTFTDFVAVPSDPSRVIRLKVASTPADPSRAVADGMTRLLETIGSAAAISRVTHGTTIGLNAIIQGKGDRVALVTTQGFPDVLEIGRSRMPSSFNLHAENEVPLVSRDHVLELAARLTPDGRPAAEPDQAGIDRVASRLIELAPQTAVLSLVGGYSNPGFEADLAGRIAAAMAARVAEPPVLIAAATMWPEIREYERTLVALMGARISGVVRRYLIRLAERLRDLDVTAPLYISGSNGGTLAVESAIERPLETVLSGPASGVTAARMHYPGENLVTFDMGGTSSDISIVVRGSSKLTTSSEIGGMALMLPVVDVSAIGAGGGSLIWADTAAATAALQVGPDSAGASPGPAAYGQGGGHPTITDAYLTMGLISADRFLGGEMRLYPELAADALASVAGDLGDFAADSQLRAAESALRLTTAQMATELQKLLAERAQDARDFTIVPYGGAGPTHAAMLAEEIGVRRLRNPDAAATYCALGAALAPLRRDFVHSIRALLSDEVAARVRDAATAILAEGRDWLAANGDDPADGTLQLALDLRYPGQAYELSVALQEWPLAQLTDGVPIDPRQIQGAFDAEHLRRYGFVNMSSPLSVGNLRVTVIGAAAPARAAAGVLASDRPPVPLGDREIRWRGRELVVGVYEFEDILPGHGIEAPAIVEHGDTTIVVPPGWRAHRLANSDLELVWLDPGEGVDGIEGAEVEGAEGGEK